MISISSNTKSSINRVEYLPKNNFRGADVSSILKKGDKALNENKFNEAYSYYKQAENRNPNEIKIYKQLGKVLLGLKKYTEAEKNFKIYLKENSEDTDIIIELGEALRKSGKYNEALTTFEYAYSIDNKNDLARRKILETKNNILAIYSPQRARKEKEEYAKRNLHEALNMTIEYMGSKYMSELKDVNFEFGKTAAMGGTGNIAQYEHSKNTITVSNDYIYAQAQVIAAYLAHESMHAHDNDPYTSIYEEQDAYETAAKFWMQNSNGIKDPEMDYTVELYKKSPEVLRERVKEIYTLRDPNITETSPNHPPDKFFHWGQTNKNNAASQSIRAYDVIA